MIAPRYRLDDAEKDKIAPHVGHKVEVMGTVDDASKSTSPTAGASSTAAPAPKLKVDSVKMLASSCS